MPSHVGQASCACRVLRRAAPRWKAGHVGRSLQAHHNLSCLLRLLCLLCLLQVQQNLLCLTNEQLHQLQAVHSDGWNWTDEGRGKWGFVSDTVGAELHVSEGVLVPGLARVCGIWDWGRVEESMVLPAL